MADSGTPTPDNLESLPREVRVANLRNALETLQIADEIAKQAYLITSSELADLMDVNASAVTSRGEYWAWRNWTVSRVRREATKSFGSSSELINYLLFRCLLFWPRRQRPFPQLR